MRLIRGSINRVGSRGQIVLAGAILVLLLLLLFVPFMVLHVGQESKDSVKNLRMSRALTLAESGLERGAWKLKENPGVWEDALAGIPILHFSGDATSVYSDNGGEYRIRIGPGPEPGQVAVHSVGRDGSTKEVRGVEAVYARGIHHAITTIGNFRYLPDFHVHWGPIASYGTLPISNAPSTWAWMFPSYSNTSYPRKFAKLGILNRDSDPTLPNTDSLEYWAYNPDMGDPPMVDLGYYRNRAQSNPVPLVSLIPFTGGGCAPWTVGQINSGPGIVPCFGGPLAVANPPGSGYFSNADNPAGTLTINTYVLKATSTVLYFDNLLVNYLGWLDVEAIIMAGSSSDLLLNASNYVYQATIPAHAQREYQHPNAQSIWTNSNPPGTASSHPSFSSVGAGNCCYPVPSAILRSFVYVGGTIEGAGVFGATMVGSVVVAGADVTSTNDYRDFTIFYDDSIADNIKLTNDVPRRMSWRQVPSSW
jgi:hypothetical protein